MVIIIGIKSIFQFRKSCYPSDTTS